MLIILIAVDVLFLVASLIYLAIQAREAQTSRSQAEKVWKLAFKEYYNRTGGDFSVACRHADAAAEVYFKAAHASEELARKASSSAVRKDMEGRLKG